MTTKHKFTKVPGLLGAPSSGRYRYRGVLVVRDDSHKGYWGHWKTVLPFPDVPGGTRERAATRAALARKIDSVLDAQQEA